MFNNGCNVLFSWILTMQILHNVPPISKIKWFAFDLSYESFNWMFSMSQNNPWKLNPEMKSNVSDNISNCILNSNYSPKYCFACCKTCQRSFIYDSKSFTHNCGNSSNLIVRQSFDIFFRTFWIRTASQKIDCSKT